MKSSAEVTAVKEPPKIEIQRPPEKPQGQPTSEQPKIIGEAEQSIVNRIAQDGNPDEVVRDIAKPPQFIRQFSKEQSPEERKQTAREIREQRKEYFGQKKTLTEQQAQTQEAISQKELSLAEQRQRLENLRDEIAELSGSRFTRLLNYVKFRGLNSDLKTAQQAYDELDKEAAVLRKQQQGVTQQQESLRDAGKLEEGRQKLQDFYKGQKEKWADAEYTKEDIAKYFTESNLASLSTEDYALLLKRFPSEIVTHVTRQGIRDHFGHGDHTAGMGAYASGFMDILKDGRLTSSFGVFLQEGLKKEAVAKALSLGKAITTKKDALLYLDQITKSSPGSPGSYSDRIAIHFAAEKVADRYYGSERGNEIFFTFPAAHVASQYEFIGRLQDTGDTMHNDKWIWANDMKGMDINVGMVFIPAEARVDARTGSRYELDENQNPIENQEYIGIIRRAAESPTFDSFVKELGKLTDEEFLQQEASLRKKVEQEFGISDKRLQDVLLGYQEGRSLINTREAERAGLKDAVYEPYKLDNAVKDALQSKGALYVETNNPVSSREFWEKYFAEHPGQKPKHIVFYEREDPTTALEEWKNAQGLLKRTEKGQGEDFGFPEHQLILEEQYPTTGMKRFRSIGKEVIEEYFSQQKAA